MTGPTERLPRAGGSPPDATTPDDGATVELPRSRRPESDRTHPPTPPHPPAPPRSGFWRELSGALAIGLTGLALAVLVLQIVASSHGMPGPGPLVVIGHFALAAAAVALQFHADRRRGPQAALAITLVLVATGVVIWFFWWA